MNTKYPEIYVASSQPARETLKSRAGLRHRAGVGGTPPKWLTGVTIPREWRVINTSIDTVIRRKVAPEIILLDEMYCASKRLYKVASSLAEKQRASSETSFIVFFCSHGIQPNIADRVQLLRYFPEPTKVEIVFNPEEMQRTVQEVIAKWQVLRMMNAEPLPRLRSIDTVQVNAEANQDMRRVVPPPRLSPLDAVQEIVQATQDLREKNGKLSAKKIALLFGVSQRELAKLLSRTPQAVFKTPDANSLQDALSFFERIARLRSILADDHSFRKWLRIANPSLNGSTPLMILQERQWQELADLVDDILTGSPS